MNFLKNLLLTFFLLATSGYQLIAQEDEKGKFELSDTEKKKYLSDVSYTVLASDPSVYSSRDKSKRIFKAVFLSYSKDLPAVYKDILPKSLGSIEIEQMDAKLPIFFPASKDKLREEIASITGPKIITFYVTINSKSYRKSGLNVPLHQKAKPEEKYYLMVDDIVSEDMAKSLNAKKFDASDYLEVKYMKLDMQPQKFTDRKVRFDITFKEIANNIHPVIIKYAGLTPEDFFLLNTVEKFNLPILINRNNEFCIEPLSSGKTGTKINVCGTIKCTKEEGKGMTFNIYYIVADGINEIIE